MTRTLRVRQLLSQKRTVNGAAAHLVNVGDCVIALGLVEFPLPDGWTPQVVVLDETNNVVSVASEGFSASNFRV